MCVRAQQTGWSAPTTQHAQSLAEMLLFPYGEFFFLLLFLNNNAASRNDKVSH